MTEAKISKTFSEADVFACAVIVQKENKILAFLRKKDGELGLPCGKVEKGESLIQAAIRECAEETGYIVAIPVSQSPYIEFGSEGGALVACFIGQIVSKCSIKNPEEGSLVWVSSEQLSNSKYGKYNTDALNYFGL